jgi:hypothetical protein
MAGIKGKSGGARQGAGRTYDSLKTLKLRIGQRWLIRRQNTEGEIAEIIQLRRNHVTMRLDDGTEMTLMK